MLREWRKAGIEEKSKTTLRPGKTLRCRIVTRAIMTNDWNTQSRILAEILTMKEAKKSNYSDR